MMKLDIADNFAGLAASSNRPAFRVVGETDRLTDVVLCSPLHLAPVPCCSVTRESLRNGFQTDCGLALEQHRNLRKILQSHGVKTHMLTPAADLPDLCFTRDTAVMTPWGLIGLNPAAGHRSRETSHLLAAAERWGAPPFARIRRGTVEGGDICIVRPGLVIIGASGERTNEAGAQELSEIFQGFGWEVVVYRFDPHFLHLDTMFCMLDAHHALACVEVLDDAFLDILMRHDIALLPVSYKEARKLGCNILSLDGRTILTNAGGDRVDRLLTREGFTTVQVDVSQFAACGGGLHCLTMPLSRISERY